MEMLICNKLLLWCINSFADPLLKRKSFTNGQKKTCGLTSKQVPILSMGLRPKVIVSLKLLITQQQ